MLKHCQNVCVTTDSASLDLFICN